MTDDDFRASVRRAAPPHLSAESLDMAIERFVREKLTAAKHISACVSAASWLEERAELERQKLQSSATVTMTAQRFTTPLAWITSDQRAEAVRPSVELVRQKAFGMANPPGILSNVTATWCAAVESDPWLGSAVQAMHTATGFSVSGLESFVLSGVQPCISSAEVVVQKLATPLPAGGTLTRQELQLSVHFGDLPNQQVNTLCRENRTAFGMHKAKRLNDEDWRFWDMVHQHGGKPTKGLEEAFWDARRLEWNAIEPARQIHTWQGMERWYDRLEQRLKLSTP